MQLYWTDFEQCIDERIAHCRRQYDWAAQVYQRLRKECHSAEEPFVDLLVFQQAMIDEMKRLQILLVKYEPKELAYRFQSEAVIRQVRLN